MSLSVEQLLNEAMSMSPPEKAALAHSLLAGLDRVKDREVQARLSCDVLLLVATDDEQKALITAAEELNLPFEERSGMYGTYFDLGQPGVSRVLAVRTAVGPFSYRGSASRAIYSKSETGATGVICLGMAFGVDPESQSYGDVLVSSAILPYDNRNVHSDYGLPTYRYNRVISHPAKRSLRTLLERASESKQRSHRVHFGAILSGGSHIACRAYRDHLVASCHKGERIIGGEMEGVGLLGLSDLDSPSWIVVKGIADFADEYRDRVIKVNRPSACLNAARFALEALQMEGVIAGRNDSGDRNV